MTHQLTVLAVALGLMLASCSDPVQPPAVSDPWMHPDSTYFEIGNIDAPWSDSIRAQEIQFRPNDRLTYFQSYRYVGDSILQLGVRIKLDSVGSTDLCGTCNDMVQLSYLGISLSGYTSMSGTLRLNDLDTNGWIAGEFDAVLVRDSDALDTIRIQNARFGGFNFKRR